MKLKTLDFRNASRDCNMRACSIMANSFAQTSQVLEELSVSMVHSRSDDWILGAVLLENLPAACPKLTKIRIFEGDGGRVPMTDEEAQNLGGILRSFQSLEDLQRSFGRKKLPQNAVDSILQAVLSLPGMKVICLDKGNAGPAGLNSLLTYLKKRVEDISLSFLVVDLPDRDLALLEKEATDKLIGFQEDKVPVPTVRTDPLDLPEQRRIRIALPPRRHRETPEPLITRINNSLRLIRLRRFVKDSNVCPAFLPQVLPSKTSSVVEPGCSRC